MTNPPIHVLDYGDPGSGKSTFLATLPKPMTVFFFDPIGKETPYLRQGNPTEIYVNEQYGVYNRDVLNDADELVVRIEYYSDMNIKMPTAYRGFLSRLQDFYGEINNWASAIIDSVTFMELCARKNEQYVTNRAAKDPRQWRGGSTDSLEEILMCSLGAMPINIGVSAHVTNDKDDFAGRMLFSPHAPGRLSTGQGLAAAFGEVYYAHIGRTKEGGKIWQLQTQLDETHLASSQIGAPNPCEPIYEALWS